MGTLLKVVIGVPAIWIGTAYVFYLIGGPARTELGLLVGVVLACAFIVNDFRRERGRKEDHGGDAAASRNAHPTEPT